MTISRIRKIFDLNRWKVIFYTCGVPNNKVHGKRINHSRFIFMYVSQHVERIFAKCIVQNVQRIFSKTCNAAFAFAFVVVVTATLILILENCFHSVIFGALLYTFEFGMRGFPRPVYRAHVQIMRFYNAPFNVAITLVHLRCNIFEKRERYSVKYAPLKWNYLFHMNIFAVIETP